MKKIVLIISALLVIVGCSNKKEDLGLGIYEDRIYKNEHFELDLEIPEEFSFLTSDELLIVNQKFQEENIENEDAKYRNVVLNISHVDGTKLTAFVDAHPEEYKHALREANSFLDYLTNERVNYKVKKSELDINGVTYHKLELEYDFNESQVNYITVRNNKLINVQINYNNDNVETASALIDLYEQ